MTLLIEKMCFVEYNDGGVIKLFIKLFTQIYKQE